MERFTTLGRFRVGFMAWRGLGVYVEIKSAHGAVCLLLNWSLCFAVVTELGDWTALAGPVSVSFDRANTEQNIQASVFRTFGFK